MDTWRNEVAALRARSPASPRPLEAARGSASGGPRHVTCGRGGRRLPSHIYYPQEVTSTDTVGQPRTPSETSGNGLPGPQAGASGGSCLPRPPGAAVERPSVRAPVMSSKALL